jgi:predicted nucleic acid-binding protein
MATILLDSCVIFDALNGKRRRAEYLQHLLAEGNLLACCAVNITEVYARLRDYETATTEHFLAALETLPIDDEIARRAGLIKREWARKGLILSVPDVMIAAVALWYEVPLLTDNKKDFPSKGLELYPLPA